MDPSRQVAKYERVRKGRKKITKMNDSEKIAK